MDRAQIVDELAAVLAAADQVDARLYAADALDDVTSQPGLRYAPAAADQSVWVVGCDGVPLGRMWPAVAGRVIGEWTCAPFGDDNRSGPFHTARQAAAALAERCGTHPRHELPAD